MEIALRRIIVLFLLTIRLTTMRYHCEDSCRVPVVFITGINPWMSGILRWIGGIFSGSSAKIRKSYETTSINLAASS